MTLAVTTLRNLGFVTVAQLLVTGMSQIALLLLARILRPDDFGLYALILSLYSIALNLSIFGLDQAAVQIREDEERLISNGFTLRTIGALISMLGLFILAPFLSSFFNQPELTATLRVMSSGLLVALMGFASSISLNRHLRFKELSISKMANALVWPVTALALALADLAFWSLILAFLLGNLAALLVLLHYSPFKVRFSLDREITRHLVRFGKYQLATGIAVLLFFSVDKMAIVRILGRETLGVYFLAFSWGTVVPTLLTSIVNNVMFPTYALIADRQSLLSRAYLKTLTYLAYASFPLGFGLASIAHPFVVTILGPQWLESVAPLTILSLVGVLSSLTSPAGNVFLATGHPELSWRQTIGVFVPYVVLIVPVTRYYGIEGVSILILIIAVVTLLWVLKMAVDLLDLSLWDVAASLWKPLVASSVMAAIIWPFSAAAPPSLVGLLGLVAFGMVIYLTMTYFLTKGAILREARELLRMALSK